MTFIRSMFTLDTIRNFLLKIFSKEFLIFLFFLALSGGFWLMMTLNETYEYELTAKVKLIDIPKNVVITEDPDSIVRFTVRDKGFVIVAYKFTKEFKPVLVSFRMYNNEKGHGVISSIDIQRQLQFQLNKSTRIVSTKMSNLSFAYNLGQHKRVPVRLLGSIAPNGNYNLAHARFYPEVVTVYADKATLDSIQWVYTEKLHITNITDTRELEVNLRKIAHAKCIPSTVKMKLIPDVLTEETVSVPIEAINIPDDKVLRTFPSKVNVNFIVAAFRLRSMPRNNETKELLPTGFKVVADYSKLIGGKSDKCRIYIAARPVDILNLQLATTAVVFVIVLR